MNSPDYITLKTERGNVFFIVLIGIAMFAALAITSSRSSNTKSANLLTQKQAELAANEILSYSQNVARGINRLVARECSENQISFEPPPYDGSTNYVNSDAPGDFSCHAFHLGGGAIKYRTFPQEWRKSGSGPIEAIITGASCIPAIGTGDDKTCAGNNNTTDSELIILITDLTDGICEKMNEELGTRTDTSSVIFNETEFNGTFLDIKDGSMNATHLEDYYSATDSACLQAFSAARFYKVLLAR